MATESFADRCLDNNARYVDGLPAAEQLPGAPTCRAAVVTCMDARVDPARALGIAEGDAHVIRNAGGVVTDDVIRSLVISQRLLGTREILVVHHTECGMATFRDDDLKADIEAETGLRPPFALEAFPDIEADVLQSVRRIKASPYLLAKDQVRGFVYDVRSRRLREVTRD